MENIEELLRDLKESPSTRWVANEVDETLSQGVSMNFKDAAEDSRFYELMPASNIPAQDKNKRQKYETSRPFTEGEKIEVILKAFEVMYLDLPAIRESAIKNLSEIDNSIESIVFSSADDDISNEKNTHEINIIGIEEESNRLRNIHLEFLEEIEK
jgi:hypothetical protein